MPQTIVVLDFGSQYTQVIARRIREANVFSCVLPFDSKVAEIRKLNPVGIVLSGGNVANPGDPNFFSHHHVEWNRGYLGPLNLICYCDPGISVLGCFHF